MCSGILRITSPRCSVSSSGSPAAGSSSSTSRGLPTTARATSTSRRSPAPSVPTLAFGSTSSPTNSIAPSTSLRRDAAAQLGVLVDHRDVVEDRELLDRLLGLERAPQPPPRAAEVRHRQQVLAEGARRVPAGRLDESAEHVEERRLAGPVGPDQPARALSNLTSMPSSGVTPPKRTVRSETSITRLAPPAGRRRAEQAAQRTGRASPVLRELVDEPAPARWSAPGARRCRTGSSASPGRRPSC